MHLATVDEYKREYELFIILEEDINEEWRGILTSQFKALGALEWDVTFSIGDKRGWGFFPKEEEGEPGQDWKPNVKEYLLERIMDLVTYWHEPSSNPYGGTEGWPVQLPKTGIVNTQYVFLFNVTFTPEPFLHCTSVIFNIIDKGLNVPLYIITGNSNKGFISQFHNDLCVYWPIGEINPLTIVGTSDTFRQTFISIVSNSLY